MRDLWQHRALPAADRLAVHLEPHACVLYMVTANNSR
jgi:hypothetical protein